MQGTLCAEPRAEAFVRDLLSQLEASSGLCRSRHAVMPRLSEELRRELQNPKDRFRFLR